jgi:hypothetical protein
LQAKLDFRGRQNRQATKKRTEHPWLRLGGHPTEESTNKAIWCNLSAATHCAKIGVAASVCRYLSFSAMLRCSLRCGSVLPAHVVEVFAALGVQLIQHLLMLGIKRCRQGQFDHTSLDQAFQFAERAGESLLKGCARIRLLRRACNRPALIDVSHPSDGWASSIDVGKLLTGSCAPSRAITRPQTALNDICGRSDAPLASDGARIQPPCPVGASAHASVSRMRSRARTGAGFLTSAAKRGASIFKMIGSVTPRFGRSAARLRPRCRNV